MTHNKIKGIVTRIRLDREFERSDDTQKALRQYVLDKTLSLEERFDIWKDCCIKIDSPWVIHKDKFGFIGAMVDSQFPCEYDKYREYTWEYFFECVKDAIEDAEENDDDYGRKALIKAIGKDITLDELKECLIKTNFGSFVMDW